MGQVLFEEGFAIKEGREQGRKEGRAENQLLWEAWMGQRLLAQERGERFDEPPPRA